jgi:hypothetical protein
MRTILFSLFLIVACKINAADFRSGGTITISEPQYKDVYIGQEM